MEMADTRELIVKSKQQAGTHGVYTTMRPHLFVFYKKENLDVREKLLTFAHIRTLT